MPAQFSELLYEQISIGNSLMASSLNSVQNTGVLDMSKFHRCMFIGNCGTLGASATLDATLRETNESGGGNSTNIAGAQITQITAANKQWSLEVNATQLTKRYVICSITNAVAASVLCVIPLGCLPRNAPANSLDDSSVAQRVAVVT